MANDNTGTRKLPISQSLHGVFPGAWDRLSWTVQENETGNQTGAPGPASLQRLLVGLSRGPGQRPAGLREAHGRGRRLPASFSIWTSVSSVGAPSRSFSVSRLPHAFRSLRTERGVWPESWSRFPPASPLTPRSQKTAPPPGSAKPTDGPALPTTGTGSSGETTQTRDGQDTHCVRPDSKATSEANGKSEHGLGWMALRNQSILLDMFMVL